jgi:hypothetical protein
MSDAADRRSGPHRPKLRPLGQPRTVTVRTDEHGAPVHVRLPGKTARRVEAVRERWRIDDEWWRETISREYWAVVLDDGRMLTLYRDLADGAWYAQRE